MTAAAAAAPAATAGLAMRLRGVAKAYGPRQVLQGIDLDVAAGECIAIVGRSGCGKTTLLRLLAQLETADAGSLCSADGQPLATQRSAIRLMFQDPRLLPWKTVAGNVALGLPGADGRARAAAALAAVGLPQRAGDWPMQLSGGQRQRVALARALAHRPRLLLLDEPLGALDALTRAEMQALIAGVQQQHRFTTVLVTHDVAEAVALADRVLLVEHGRLALDQRLHHLPRPRLPGDLAAAQAAAGLLQRLLAPPAA